MKLHYITLFIAGIISAILISCKDEFDEYKISSPTIHEVSVSPATFNFGDSIMINAKIEDKETNLTMMFFEISDESHRVISKGQIPLDGKSIEINHSVRIPLLKDQNDNSNLKVKVTVSNILKGISSKEAIGIVGKRPIYQKLFIVTDEGSTIPLSLKDGSKDIFISGDLTLDSSISFKIAEKIKEDNKIDYNGHVYGNENGHINMINENGESAFIFVPNSDYTKNISFNLNSFDVTAIGDKLDENSIALANFDNISINSESFRTMKISLEKDKVYLLFGELADKINLYNTDFFERVEDNKVKFLRTSNDYTLYYNPVRKNIIVGVEKPSFPDFLLASGFGLGYPTNVSSNDISKLYPNKQRTHTEWGFDNIHKFTLLPRISDGIYQGTFYTPGDNDKYAGFKLFENTGWGNEKKAGMFNFTGAPIIKGDNNWEIPNGSSDPIIEPANYRFTVNLNNNTVHIEEIKF